jgi:hypothetical protein
MGVDPVRGEQLVGWKRGDDRAELGLERLTMFVERTVGEPEEAHVVVGETETSARLETFGSSDVVVPVGDHDDLNSAAGRDLAGDGRTTANRLVVAVRSEDER